LGGTVIERDKIYISNIKIHYSSIVWLGHVYTINAIYHQITKGKDENLVKYHASHFNILGGTVKLVSITHELMNKN
jgi:hypothetical protein